MKGVLKIKILKKYIPIFLMAFAFFYVNVREVSAYNSEKKLGNHYITTSSDILEINENVYEDVSGNSYRYAFNNIFKEYNYVYIRGNFKYLIPQVNGRYEYYYSDNFNNGVVIATKNMYVDNSESNTNTYYYLTNSNHANVFVPEVFYFNNLPDNAVLVGTPEEIYNEDISNLNYDINNNEITFNYELPTDDNFSHLELHQDGLLLADNIVTNNFEVTNLEYDTKYNFTFYSVDINGNKSAGISREILLPKNPALIPSNNIFNLNHSVSDTTVSFNYSLPSDPNFSHLKIYRNNELITDNYQLSEFTDINLTPETEYNYRFVSVNKMDISNAGYSLTVKTMIENDTVPPAVPTGLNAKAMNSGIILNWNSNNETDLKGYNIYLNGTKLNKNPISNTIYNVTNLENGTEYNFTVSAVDTFDNESEQSLVVSSVPDVDKLPIFKLDTSLSSVGSSIENWFSQIWVIVAFATSIPLSFLIANRIKSLFIA